ncbi:MAG TPA: DUF4058 family protein [Tepidisphaeraceae bacterium]|nr:DUF4058 family protein [Tepidisphaeraceae bacterium]
MPSPFPGMDPYLERHWRDVHSDLVAVTRRTLNEHLPADLVARMEERVVIDDTSADRQRAIFPDVRVYEDPNGPAGSGPAPGGEPGVARPIVLELEVEEHTETFIQIVEANGGRLVTVVEYLSPTNKLPGRDRDDFKRKRDELWRAGVNVVEIDLLRVGAWRDLLRPFVAPRHAESEYRVVGWRVHPRRRVELYPLGIRDRLPRIPVPLREGDPDTVLDLQAAVDEVYRGGRYDRTDYRRPCEPPLGAELSDWANGLLNRI